MLVSILQGHILPGVPSKTQYPPPGPTPRGLLGNRISGAHGSEPAGASSYSPLIGRKVRTRWPDDNNFYEAVITNYDEAQV